MVSHPIQRAKTSGEFNKAFVGLFIPPHFTLPNGTSHGVADVDLRILRNFPFRSKASRDETHLNNSQLGLGSP